jgi:hypothetical protein
MIGARERERERIRRAKSFGDDVTVRLAFSDAFPA